MNLFRRRKALLWYETKWHLRSLLKTVVISYRKCVNTVFYIVMGNVDRCLWHLNTCILRSYTYERVVWFKVLICFMPWHVIFLPSSFLEQKALFLSWDNANHFSTCKNECRPILYLLSNFESISKLNCLSALDDYTDTCVFVNTDRVPLVVMREMSVMHVGQMRHRNVWRFHVIYIWNDVRVDSLIWIKRTDLEDLGFYYMYTKAEHISGLTSIHLSVVVFFFFFDSVDIMYKTIIMIICQHNTIFITPGFSLLTVL